MKILLRNNDLNEALSGVSNIGFVPTMGSLHKGHISLIKKSLNYCNKTVVSIFINPTQFNNKNDYKKYKCCVSYRGCTHDFNFPNYSNFHYEKRTNTIPRTLYNFANSGVGTITHPSFFHKTKNLIFDLKLIKDLCPTTDDIWYYFCRIANNIDTVIINKPNFFQFFNNQDYALFFNYNNVDDRNTLNIKKTAIKFHELKLI